MGRRAPSRILPVFLPFLLDVFTLSQSSSQRHGDSKLLGFRISKYSSMIPISCSDDMLIPELPEGTEVTIRIVGHLADVREVALTGNANSCDTVFPETLSPVEKESDEVGSITLSMPLNMPQKKTTLYYCFRAGEEHDWVHQGGGYWAKLIVVHRFTNIYVAIIGCMLCVIIAAMMNTSLIRLLSLDMAALNAKAESGTERERRVCRALINIRKRGHIIAMAFIPGIVFFKTSFVVLLRYLFSGWLAVVVSTIIIVLFVEVIPRVRKRSENSNESMEIQAESSVISKYKEDERD